VCVYTNTSGCDSPSPDLSGGVPSWLAETSLLHERALHRPRLHTHTAKGQCEEQRRRVIRPIETGFLSTSSVRKGARAKRRAGSLREHNFSGIRMEKNSFACDI
jgi:hypothetical protein